MNNTIMNVLTERAKEEGKQPQEFINNYLIQKSIDQEKTKYWKEQTINILKKLDEIHKNLVKDSKRLENTQDILIECFKRAGVPIPQYKSYVSNINLLGVVHKGNVLTFDLKDNIKPNDLKIYLIEYKKKLIIGIYDQKKDKFIIDNKNTTVPKEDIKIKGYLVRIESN